MAVFLANSGGAWDNAKKMVEDGSYGGKGSEAHAATGYRRHRRRPVQGHGRPAINPLIKVMNLVSVLVAPAVVQLSLGDSASAPLRAVIAVLAFAIIVAAITVSKRRKISMGRHSGPGHGPDGQASGGRDA